MNILTIDFDIIMHKNILLYDKDLYLISNNTQEIQQLQPDMEMYNLLTQYLLSLPYLSYQDIFFIENHDQVCDIIAQRHATSIDLTNIDFHYDAYDDGDKSYNCGNWVHYLLNNKLLSSYIWCRSKESISMINKRILPMDLVQKEQIFDPTNIKITPDILILCLSPEWLPKHIQPLFYDWIKLLSQQKQYQFELVKPGMIYKNMV